MTKRGFCRRSFGVYRGGQFVSQETPGCQVQSPAATTAARARHEDAREPGLASTPDRWERSPAASSDHEGVLETTAGGRRSVD